MALIGLCDGSWKQASATARNADTFLSHLHGAVAAIISDPAAAGSLQPLAGTVAAAAPLADAVDGRLFHAVLAVLVAEGAEGLLLPPQASRAAPRGPV